MEVKVQKVYRGAKLRCSAKKVWAGPVAPPFPFRGQWMDTEISPFSATVQE